MAKVRSPVSTTMCRSPPDAELKAWDSLPFDEEEYRKNEVGSHVLTGRARLLGAASHLGASDPRGSRHRWRFRRSRRQDRDTCEG